jgi:medium-chain acyl-[acyl-carrier-protein] hydrolase
MTTRWLRTFGSRAPGDLRLFCFHHAGGAAAAYREWPRLLPTGIEPVAVQLPGRAERFREPALDRMPVLLDHLVEELRPLLGEPYALYGLSMGARVAWALTHRLRDEGLPMPSRLFLANVAAPGRQEGQAVWTDAAVLDYLRQMGGTPPEIFAEPALLAGLLPALRADLTLVDSFHWRPATPLTIPIHAFAGMDDREGAPERMREWRAETVGDFALDVVSGGHFFDPAGTRQVIGAVAGDLLRATARTDYPIPTGGSLT